MELDKGILGNNQPPYLDIYKSYVDRLHQFRREQQAIVLLLSGLFALVVKTLFEMENKNDSTAQSLYQIVAIASLILSSLFLNQGYRVTLFARLLKNLEKLLYLPPEVHFYIRHSRLRKVSFLFSLSLPFVLFGGVNLVFVTLTNIPLKYYVMGMGAHIGVFIIAYWQILALLSREDRKQ